MHLIWWWINLPIWDIKEVEIVFHIYCDKWISLQIPLHQLFPDFYRLVPPWFQVDSKCHPPLMHTYKHFFFHFGMLKLENIMNKHRFISEMKYSSFSYFTPTVPFCLTPPRSFQSMLYTTVPIVILQKSLTWLCI